MNSAGRRRRRSRSNSPFGDEVMPVTHFDFGMNDNVESRLNGGTKTAFVYDKRMLLHANMWDELYFEKPERLSICYDRIVEAGLLEDCLILEAKEATTDLLLLNHSEQYIQLVEATEAMTRNQLKDLSSQHDAAFFNNNTKTAALVSAGSTIEVVKAVLEGRARNGFCLVRPPGHHALESEAYGFCIFNNVALAARYANVNYSVQRILIIDWDVHHGQGTQYKFYNSAKVLYVSIHRFEDGRYWPKLRESNFDYIGTNEGKGFNINIPLNETGMTNSDYLTIFNNLIMPIAYEFNPELVLVSAGYDAAIGCPEGMMNVHPACFGYLTHKLMDLARGRVILVLEGGYCLDSLADSSVISLATLQGKPLPMLEPLEKIKDSTIQTIHNCIKFLMYYWKSLSVNVAASEEPYPEYLQSLQFSTCDVARNPMLPVETNPLKHGLNPKLISKIHELREINKIPIYQNRTCFVYDCRMENHMNERTNHPESPRRTQRIFEHLRDNGLLQYCRQLETRSATIDELNFVHAQYYINKLETVCKETIEVQQDFEDNCNSIYVNQHSYSSALLSAGSLLSIIDEVCSGSSQNGFAIIRPPGHHAEVDNAMGFCFFNNVAIATKYALKKYSENIKKVLIVDWDVHHGNGTQSQFWTDPSVLYISLHRYDNGAFFPSTEDASPSKVGQSDGLGFNINIAWNKRPIRDSEYMAAFLNVVMPVAHEFNPDLVVVSCGFDAARGDPLGCLSVTPECFSHLTQMLMCLANGKIVLALEGGYNLNVISECMTQCVCTLLGHPSTPLIHFPPNKNGIEAIRKTVDNIKLYWDCFRVKEPIAIYTEAIPYQTTSTVITNAQQIEANMLSESMRQLAVEVAYQTEQSIEESISQQQLDMVAAEPIPENTESGTIRVEIHQDSDSHAVTNLRNVSSLPVTTSSNIAAQIDQSSGANPQDSSAPRVVQEGNSVGFSVQDLMNYAGLRTDTFHDLFGLSPGQNLPETMYAVQPITWCPHLMQVRQSPPANDIDVNAPCVMCPSNHENWLCLTCYQVFCARYVEGHMLQHFSSTRHSFVLSFADLSCWCYECDSYVHNEVLNSVKREAHMAKFGFLPPESSGSSRQ